MVHVPSKEDQLSILCETVEYRGEDKEVTFLFDVREIGPNTNPLNLFKSHLGPDVPEVFKVSIRQCTTEELQTWFEEKEVEAIYEEEDKWKDQFGNY